MAVVIDDAVMFLDSLKDRPSPPNDYPGVEKIVDRILGCAKGRFDRVMLYLQGGYMTRYMYVFALPSLLAVKNSPSPYRRNRGRNKLSHQG